MNVVEVPKMSTDPGGPWLAFLAGLTHLPVPFEAQEIPSRARREAAMQVAVDRVEQHLRGVGVSASAWVKRVEGRLMARVYFGGKKNYLFAYPENAVVSSSGVHSPKVEVALNAYEAEVKQQEKTARTALRAAFPKVRRPKKWKFQHLGLDRTLVFAGGRYFLVEA